jgi:hypothetical protein
MTCFTSSSGSVAKRSFLSGVSLRPCVVVNAPLRMRKAQSVVGLAMASAAAAAAAAAAPAITEEGEGSLEQWVRQMLPGGFAAQRLIGTGRRKTAVARVVLIDGTGQIIINNRTAQVLLFALLSFFFFPPLLLVDASLTLRASGHEFVVVAIAFEVAHFDSRDELHVPVSTRYVHRRGNED